MSANSDTNFDGIATSFEKQIYGSPRGYVRLHVLWEDLISEIPRITHGDLSILDAGGGAGHVALRMAELGNRVVLCDTSREMLSKADESIRAADLSGSVTTIHSSIQGLGKSISGKFDVITCHAVLE